MQTHNILVIGHSHVGAIRAAATIRREANPDAPRVRTIYLLDDAFGSEMVGERFSAGVAGAILAQVGRHNPIIASVIGGNIHSAMTLIPYRRFDFVLSGDAALPIEDGVEILDEADVRAELTNRMQPEIMKMRLLRDMVGPFWQLESPPPVRNGDWVKAHAEKYFTDQPAFAELGVAPAGVRYRAWRLACRIFREECERLGCRYVEVPKTMVGAAGLLRPSQARDATHGNGHFGEAMIQELERSAT